MQLKTHNDAISLLDGKALLRAEYSPRDGATGEVLFRLEDQDSLEQTEVALRVDPWSPDAFEVYEWAEGKTLVVCCAHHIISLNLENLELRASVGLEYEEAENIDRPWFFVSRELGGVLVVATERKVFCLESRGTMKWIWSVRYDEKARWIFDSPRAVGAEVHVPTRTMGGDSVAVLALRGGLAA